MATSFRYLHAHIGTSPLYKKNLSHPTPVVKKRGEFCAQNRVGKCTHYPTFLLKSPQSGRQVFLQSTRARYSHHHDSSVVCLWFINIIPSRLLRAFCDIKSSNNKKHTLFSLFFPRKPIKIIVFTRCMLLWGTAALECSTAPLNSPQHETSVQNHPPMMKKYTLVPFSRFLGGLQYTPRVIYALHGGIKSGAVSFRTIFFVRRRLPPSTIVVDSGGYHYTIKATPAAPACSSTSLRVQSLKRAPIPSIKTRKAFSIPGYPRNFAGGIPFCHE